MSPEQNYKNIIKEISLLTNQPMYSVEHVLQYVFGKIRDSSYNEELESFRIKGFGSFVVSKKAMEYHRKKIAEKNHYREWFKNQRLKELQKDGSS